MTEIKHGENIRARILDAIIEYIKKHGYSPSVREIGEMVNLKSSSTVHAHLKIMLDSGIIETDSEFSTPRAIRVPGYEFVKKEDSAWIPCNERLPEEHQNVIACFTHGLVTELTYYSGEFHGMYHYNTKVIVAWQPLPEPYKKEMTE